MKAVFTSVALLLSGLTWLGISNVAPASAAEANDVTLEVLSPIGRVEVERVNPSPRVTDLNNKRVLLYYVKGNSTEACEQVQKRFKERFKGQEFMFIAGTATRVPLVKEKVDAIVKFKPDIIFATNAD